jgi:exopolysaccharide biosynthesis WecB/TagA/CpsF family protein
MKNPYPKSIRVLNVDILSIGLHELLETYHEGILLTPNVDHIMKLQRDKDFLDIYRKAEWVVCDSKIVGLAASYLGKPFQEVIPGSSFLPAFYQFHKQNREVKIFLLGALDGVAKKAMENINEKVGWNMVVNCFSPSFGFENNAEECARIIKKINESGANTLVIGVGAPKQEKWVMKYKSSLPHVKRYMALGATIDFEAGHIQRAPLIFRKLYIEWFYRFLMEPKRLFKRYFVDDMPFFGLILQQKWGKYKNPLEEGPSGRNLVEGHDRQFLAKMATE